MNAKYYTPEIEEFHVGFEYELFNGDNWQKRTVGRGVWDLKGQIKKFLDKEHIRVKHLDRDDIDSLGWTSIGDNVWEKWSNPKYAQWKLKMYNDKVSITFFHPDDSKGELHFFGTIKNKSELKRILKMIGI